VTLALCGYATRWNHIIDHHGNSVMLLPGCFDKTLRSGAVVRLLLNHNDSDCVGATDDKLQLASDPHGLAFRYRITDTQGGQYVQSMAEFSNCMSIGFDYPNAKTENRCINGVDVICIVSATLWEISFMAGLDAGAVKDAYATLKKTDYSKNLRDECEGGRFLYDSAAVAFTRSLQKLMDA